MNLEIMEILQFLVEERKFSDFVCFTGRSYRHTVTENLLYFHWNPNDRISYSGNWVWNAELLKVCQAQYCPNNEIFFKQVVEEISFDELDSLCEKSRIDCKPHLVRAVFQQNVITALQARLRCDSTVFQVAPSTAQDTIFSVFSNYADALEYLKCVHRGARSILMDIENAARKM